MSITLNELQAPGAIAKISVGDWADKVVGSSEDHRIVLFLPPFFRGETRLLGSRSGRFVPNSPVSYFPAHEIMEGRSTGGQIRTLRCTFSEERFRQVVGADFRWQQDEIERGFKLDSSPILPSMIRIVEEVRNPGFNSEMMLDSLMTTMILDLTRYLHAPAPDRWTPEQAGKFQLARIRQRIEADDKPAPSVPELANLCGIGERHLARMFKGATGRTISGCVREAQIVRARRMLGETDLPLKEIAYQLGFAGHSSFATTFRKVVGETPKAFRWRSRQATTTHS